MTHPSRSATLIRCPACGARLPAVMVTDRDCVLCRLEAA